MKAGRELDHTIAEKVMGWRSEEVLDWSPSTNIAAAWQVIARLGAYDLSLTKHAATWTARFIQWGPSMQHHTGVAETAEEAICLAALQTAEG